MNRINNLIIILLTTLVVMMLVSGCSPVPTAAPSGESLAWEKIAQSDGSASGFQYQGTPKVEVISQSSEATALEEQVYSGILHEITNTDFSTHLVMIVFQGYQGATDYSVRIKEVRRQGNSITVYAEFLTPDPQGGISPIATSPYYVLKVTKVPDLRGDFTFILVANGKEIERQQHFIP